MFTRQCQSLERATRASDNSMRIRLRAAHQLPAVFQAFYDLLMNVRSLTSKTRRVYHGHARHLIHTGRIVEQVSIARPPTGGGGHAPPAPGWIRHWRQVGRKTTTQSINRPSNLGEQRGVGLQFLWQVRRAVTQLLLVDVQRVLGQTQSYLLSFCTDHQTCIHRLHLSRPHKRSTTTCHAVNNVSYVVNNLENQAR